MKGMKRLRCHTNANVILSEENVTDGYKKIEDIEKGKTRPDKPHKTSRNKEIRPKINEK